MTITYISYLDRNRGKKSILLNIESQKHIDIFCQIIPQIDVLIDPFLPDKLKEFGLGFEKLNKLNPKLIIAHITGYGQDSPLKDKAYNNLTTVSYSGNKRDQS